MPGDNPPTEEVVQALAQMALLAVMLATVVVIVRVWQVSVDKRQAERARLEAIESTRQRLRTLADRNIFYGSGSGSIAPAAVTPPRWLGDSGSLSSPFDLDHAINSLDRPYCQYGRSQTRGSMDSACPGSNQAYHDAIQAVPASKAEPACGGSGGGVPPFVSAAASALLHRRNTTSTLNPCTSSDCHSALSSGAFTGAALSSLEPGSSTGEDGGRSQSVCGNDGVTWFASAVAPQRNSGGDGGNSASDELRRRYALQHKFSDSLLETGSVTREVLASTPQETITSTRQVLAHFNYDYSALHRREARYAGSAFGRGSGSGPTRPVR